MQRSVGLAHLGWLRHAAPRFVDFRAEDGELLRGVILLPPAGAATEVNGKVPLILNPYGGPQGQSVRDAAHTVERIRSGARASRLRRTQGG